MVIVEVLGQHLLLERCELVLRRVSQIYAEADGSAAAVNGWKSSMAAVLSERRELLSNRQRMMLRHVGRLGAVVQGSAICQGLLQAATRVEIGQELRRVHAAMRALVDPAVSDETGNAVLFGRAIDLRGQVRLLRPSTCAFLPSSAALRVVWVQIIPTLSVICSTVLKLEVALAQTLSNLVFEFS